MLEFFLRDKVGLPICNRKGLLYSIVIFWESLYVEWDDLSIHKTAFLSLRIIYNLGVSIEIMANNAKISF